VQDEFDNTFENFDEFERRMKFEGYYGDFSSDTRRKLLSKNLKKVNNVYEILYNDEKLIQLSKNEPIVDDKLEGQSESIRLNILRKNVESKINFDEINESARKQSESRNTLSKTISNLESIGEIKRDELLSKNDTSFSFPDTEDIRKEQLASNVDNKLSIDTYASKELESELASNVESKNNIDNYAIVERVDELSKNVDNKLSIDTYADSEKVDELASNLPTGINIDTYADSERVDELSKNVDNKLSIDTYASKELNDELASNVVSKLNIDTYDDTERSDELSANVSIDINIDSYANNERVDELSSNVSSNINIDTYANNERSDELSSNLDSTNNIDTYANSERVEELAANVPSGLNMDSYSSQALNDGISSNSPSQINIDTYADAERIDELSANATSGLNIDTYDDVERADELASNLPTGINIDTYASSERTDELSSNLPIGINIDTYDDTERSDELASNLPIGINIDSYASDERTDELSANVPIGINIDTYDDAERLDELSANVPIGINIDTYDDLERVDELSANVPIGINIDTYDDLERVDELSANVPIGINIDTYDDLERIDELSANVPIGINIDTYDDLERVDELSANVPIGINIDTYDDAERLDELSANVPIGINIDTYDDLERVDELSANVPIGINIDTYAGDEIIDELSANVPLNINIGTYAPGERTDELSKNVPSNYNLEHFIDAYGNFSSSHQIKNNELSKNVSSVLGVNVPIGGTSVFLGISNLLIQGAIIRPLMRLRNKYNAFKSYQPPREQYMIAIDDKISLNAIPAMEYGLFSINSAKEFYARSNENRLSLVMSDNIDRQFAIGLTNNYSITPTNFVTYVSGYKTFSTGYGRLTKAIREYNLARNYSSSGIDIVAAQQELEEALYKIYNNHSVVPGSNDQQGMGLVNSYINTRMLAGKLDKPLEKTNADTFGINVVDLLKKGNYNPGTKTFEEYSAGTAGSMMSQVVTSDSIENNFLKGEGASTATEHSPDSKGVRKIIDIISQASVPLAQNYQRSQNEFLVSNSGDNGKPILAYQRYTYANPYKVDGSSVQQFNFSFTNYANGITMYFPPYIKSYRNDANVDWAAHDFLGRPESIYTYNKSNRSGSIQFVVLTDYAEKIKFGVDYPTNQDKFFSTTKKFSNSSRVFEEKLIKSKIKKLEDENSKLNKQLAQANTLASPTDTATINKEISENQKTISQLQEQLKNYQPTKGATPYYEFGNNTNYQQALYGSVSQNTPWEVTDTLKYITEIEKNLLFVPGFFSGSKADFQTKMDFLMKMTRPAKNLSNSSFAFTRPPVCHVVLGDWFDYDIIIDSVSFDYSESVWTLDENYESRVQPMFATVDVNFKIVGSYGGGGRPPLATDVNGFFYAMGK
jgi:hypothetical protein